MQPRIVTRHRPSLAPANQIGSSQQTLPLLRPFDPAAAETDFDTYERSMMTALLLDRLLQGVATPARILEVGSRCPSLGGWLTPGAAAFEHRAFPWMRPTDRPAETWDPAGPLPFEDERFEAVILSDSLDHVEESRRGAVLGECVRVSRRGFILSTPAARPEVSDARSMLEALVADRLGRAQVISNGPYPLPDEAALRHLLNERDLRFAVHESSPLDVWLGLQTLAVELHDREHAGQLLGRLNLALQRGQIHGRARGYRQFYVAAKSFEASAALEPPAGMRLSADPADPGAAGDPGTAGTAGTGRAPAPLTLASLHAVAALAADVLHRFEHDTREETELHSTHLVQARQQELILNSFIRSLQTSVFWKLMAPFRVAREWLFPRGFTEAALVPSRDLEPLTRQALGGWRATGPDAQFVVPCYLPRGWVRVRLTMTCAAGSRFELFLDHGDGFHIGSCAERGEVREKIDDDFFIFLEKPARGARFDPVDAETTFRLDRLRVEPVPPHMVLWHAAAGKLEKLWAHGLLWRCAARGVGLLAQGRFAEFKEKMLGGLDGPSYPWLGYHDMNADYSRWRKQQQPSDDGRSDRGSEIQAMDRPPVISVLMPVYNVPEPFLRLAIESVLGQSYPNWQLCIADDGSTAPHVKTVLAEYARLDTRIEVSYRPVNGGISAASNEALSLARGEYVALLDHDDELAADALLRVAQRVVADRSVDMIYSDMDMKEMDGRHVEPFFKPDWSPEYLLGCMYVAHLGVYRTALVREIGGFRSEFDLAQDYDLTLRVCAKTDRIAHIPEILYHWRKLPTSTAASVSAKPQAHRTARRALASYLAATGRQARVEPTTHPCFHRVRFAITGRPKVSIIIPTASRTGRIRGRDVPLVLNCVESIRRKTTYPDVEILVVDNDDMPAGLEKKLRSLGAAKIPYTDPFNLSTKMNLGAAKAAGDHLLFLNDDTEVITPDWVESMLEYSQQPGVGAVGVRLLFPDGRIQHVGVTILDGKPLHHFYGYPANYQGHFGGNLVVRNYSAVTGACLMMPADVFHAAGGFDEAFPLNFNDVDLCLKVVTSGKRIVYTPFAQLYHYEAASKTGCFAHELELFQRRWKDRYPRDPYFNPNLSTNHHDYRLAVDAVA